MTTLFGVSWKDRLQMGYYEAVGMRKEGVGSVDILRHYISEEQVKILPVSNICIYGVVKVFVYETAVGITYDGDDLGDWDPGR